MFLLHKPSVVSFKNIESICIRLSVGSPMSPQARLEHGYLRWSNYGMMYDPVAGTPVFAKMAGATANHMMLWRAGFFKRNMDMMYRVAQHWRVYLSMGKWSLYPYEQV